MSVTEYQRHQVFAWFEEHMGSELAPVMMELVPPVGWGDVATKRDLDQLRSELRGEIGELRGELHREISSLQRHLISWMLGINAATLGLLATLIAFVG